MKKILAISMAVLFICSCSSSTNADKADEGSSGVKTVTIRSGSSETVYKVDKNNLVTKSSLKNAYGIVDERSYAYDQEKTLSSIVKTNSVIGSQNIYFSTEKDRSANDRVKTRVKTIPNSRGTEDILTVNYYYDDAGKVIGMIQTDSKGNIIAKGVNN